MIEVARQAYPDRDTLMRDLAELVADQLRAAHASKDRATLAVPGGTTPGPFLRALSEAELAWEDVDVLPTDERMVSETSSRSNARLIRETLLQEPAAAAQLRADCTSRCSARMRARVAAVLPIDVLVLGMGADMHTASLFPGAPELAAALADGRAGAGGDPPAGAAGGAADADRAGFARGVGDPYPDHRGRQARGARDGARGRAGRRGAGAGGADRALPGDRPLRRRERGGSHVAQRHRRPRHRTDRRALGAGPPALSRPHGAAPATRGRSRAHLACGNQAHAYAAMPARDKAVLVARERRQPRDRHRLQRHAVGAPALRDLSGADPPGGARGRRHRAGRGRGAGDVRRRDPGPAGDGAQPLLPRRDRDGGGDRAQPQRLRLDGLPRGLRQDRAGARDRRGDLRPPAGGVPAGGADDERHRERRRRPRCASSSPPARSGATR